MNAIPRAAVAADIERFVARDVAARTRGDRVRLARDVIAWAYATYGADLTVASSMGDEALLHVAAQAAPGIDVFFLDTGYHFAETLGTRDAYAVMLPLSIRTVVPELTVAEQDVAYGPRLHERDPDRCCAMRKVAPLEKALEGYAAWITGVRRVDAITRAGTPVVEWDEKRSMLKINPIVGWSHDEVDMYAAEHGIFLNPLRELGFASIGCSPCTRPVADGEDQRSGRWSGKNKVECGLHI